MLANHLGYHCHMQIDNRKLPVIFQMCQRIPSEIQLNTRHHRLLHNVNAWGSLFSQWYLTIV